MGSIKVVALTKGHEGSLFQFMSRDKVSHFFSIYDLKYFRDRSLVWLALSADNIVGYLLEYGKRILCTRGRRECIIPLLKNSTLTEAMLNIAPHHLPEVEKMFKPVEPADKATMGKITTFLVMKATPDSFKAKLCHEIRELKRESAQELAGLLGVQLEQATDLLKGFAFGMFKRERLVSYAASPEFLEDLAIVRGVFTAPDERGKGYSKSVCSALVRKLLGEGKEAMLYVSRDNAAALNVYREVGFKETGHRFLGFTARKKD